MEAGEEIITLATYYDPMLAHIVRSKLEDSGIPCFIADENLGSMYPVYNAAIGGIKLKIFARDLEKCKAILAEDNNLNLDELPETELNEQVICPICGSANVKYDAETGQDQGLFARLFSALKPDDKQFHCLNCGKDFE